MSSEDSGARRRAVQVSQLPLMDSAGSRIASSVTLNQAERAHQANLETSGTPHQQLFEARVLWQARRTYIPYEYRRQVRTIQAFVLQSKALFRTLIFLY